MLDGSKSYSDVRLVFANNLRNLIQRSGSTVSGTAQETGLSRQQISRYLSGVVLPNIECLQKILRYFEVDERILFTPLEELERQNQAEKNAVTFSQAFGLPEDSLEVGDREVSNGFYRVWKPTYAFRDTVNVSLSLVSQQGVKKIVKGIDPKALSPASMDGDLAISKRSHFGVFCRCSDGMVVFCRMPQGNFLTCTILQSEFGWRVRKGSFFGSCATTAMDSSFVSDGTVGIVYERISQKPGDVLAAARACGARPAADVPTAIQELLVAGCA